MPQAVWPQNRSAATCEDLVMRWFNQLYRALFCQRGKHLLLDLHNGRYGAIAGIVLEEVGRPNGTVTLHKWWQTQDTAFYERSERIAGASSEFIPERVNRSSTEFDNLLRTIESLDKPKILNFSGALRDGVSYSVAWDGKACMRDLTIQNPTADSCQARLIQQLKDNVWS